MSDFAFRIIADIKGYQAEMAKLPGATEKAAFAASTKLVTALETSGRMAGQKAGKAMTSAMSGATKAGAVNLANQVSDVFSQMATGTSPLTIMIQQGPQAAGALQLMGVSLVSLTAGMAGLTAAVIAGYGAWTIYNADTVEAARIAESVSAAHKELAPLLDATRAATIDLSEATGELSPLMADLERNSARALKAWGSATDETRAKVKSLRTEQEGLKGQAQDIGHAFYEAIDPTGLLVEGFDRLWGSTAATQREIDALNGVIDRSVVALDENRRVTEDTIVAKNAAALAEKRLKEALDASRKAWDQRAADLAAIVRGYGQWASAIGQLEEMETRATTSQLSGIEAVDAAQAESIARAKEAAQEADRGAGESAERRAETARQLSETLAAIDEEAAAKRAKIREDEAKAAEKEAERIAALQYAAADRALSAVTSLTEQAYDQRLAAAERTDQALKDGYGDLTRAETEQLQRRLQGQRRAALAWWAANKASALAQGIVNTELAVSNALASAPPPLNAALAVAAGIAGAAQVAQIATSAPPSFHRGTQGASSQRRGTFMAELETGEAVIPKEASRDPRNQDMIARMRGDRMSGGATVVTVDRYDGRAFGRGIRDQLRAGGDLRRAIASTNPHLGHR